MVAGSGAMPSATPIVSTAVGGNGSCTSVGGNTSNVPGTTNVPTTPQGTDEASPTRTRASENRRSNKPIMEKRRRARINNCLNELKTLILDAMKKDPARHSKLEKADILEMTVKHLEALQRQQVVMATANDPNVANKFRAGFTECAGEVGRFPGLDGPVKRRLLQHLANCLNSASPPTTTATAATTTEPGAAQTNHQPLQVHILRTPVQSDAPVVQQTNPSNIILTNTNGQGMQLVPTRLPNGDIALILPSSNSFRTARAPTLTTPSASPSPSVSSNSSGSSPLPMLIPISNRSNNSSPSPVALDRLSVNSTTPPRQITILTTQNPQRLLLPQKEKNVPILTTASYQFTEVNEKIENLIPQRVIIPESYLKPEKVMKTFDELPVIHNMQSPYIKTRKEDPIENSNNYNGNSDQPIVEDSLYERNRIIMTHDGQIIDNEHQTGYVSDKMYCPERETLLHIPEREYYETGPRNYSPRSPVGYIESMEDHRFTDYYSDHLERRYSPELQKPLALVTKKKYEEYENEERPWRPW